MKKPGKQNNKILPSFFKPILWSYDFSKINPEKDKESIIIQAINYGNLQHWRWLVKFYGTEEVREVLTKTPATEIRPRAQRLSSIIFSIKKFNYAPRGTR